MMIVVTAIATTLLAAYYGHQYWQITAEGISTPALSIKVERQQALGKIVLGDPYRYYADYTFEDSAGKVHSARRTIGRGLYEKLNRPDKGVVAVHYSRARPDVNALDMSSARWLPILLSALAAVIWVAALMRLLRS
ncbi:MAG: hypothetical protein WC829_06040 [Hyphomicrobium sp.]|jgi:hypothetical protein